MMAYFCPYPNDPTANNPRRAVYCILHVTDHRQLNKILSRHLFRAKQNTELMTGCQSRLVTLPSQSENMHH